MKMGIRSARRVRLHDVLFACVFLLWPCVDARDSLSWPFLLLRESFVRLHNVGCLDNSYVS